MWFNHQSSSRSSTKKHLVHNFTRTNKARDFYFNRVVRLWNKLPKINLENSFSALRRILLNFCGTISCILLTRKIYAHTIFVALVPPAFNLISFYLFIYLFKSIRYTLSDATLSKRSLPCLFLSLELFITCWKTKRKKWARNAVGTNPRVGTITRTRNCSGRNNYAYLFPGDEFVPGGRIR